MENLISLHTELIKRVMLKFCSCRQKTDYSCIIPTIKSYPATVQFKTAEHKPSDDSILTQSFGALDHFHHLYILNE